jgi:hypothetical protein
MKDRSVRPEHLLLGVLEDDVVRRLLARLGASPDAVRAAVLRRVAGD